MNMLAVTAASMGIATDEDLLHGRNLAAIMKDFIIGEVNERYAALKTIGYKRWRGYKFLNENYLEPPVAKAATFLRG